MQWDVDLHDNLWPGFKLRQRSSILTSWSRDLIAGWPLRCLRPTTDFRSPESPNWDNVSPNKKTSVFLLISLIMFSANSMTFTKKLYEILPLLSPVRHQAITWTSAGLLSIGTLGTNFSEIRIKIFIHKMHLNVSAAKWRPFVPGEMT